MIDIPDSIFPTDEQGRQLCPRCKKILSQCQCPSYEPVKAKAPKWTPSIRLDKSGRKGKIVTMIEGLPSDEKLLKNLSKKLKTKTGSGGTYYFKDGNGIIEIQGDHKDVVWRILNDE